MATSAVAERAGVVFATRIPPSRSHAWWAARSGFLRFPSVCRSSARATPCSAPILEPHKKIAQRDVYGRKQTMSILFGIAALIASIGVLVLCSGIGIYFLSNSRSKLAERL